MLRSSNCSAYTDTVSVLVNGRAFVPDDDACSVDLKPMFSCQTSQFEAPDEATHQLLFQSAKNQLDALGCDTANMQLALDTNLVGAQNMEYSAEKLRDLGMVSNCYKEGNDPNDATHRAEARCFNQREMTDAKGRRVINTNMPIHSNLAACDVSSKASDQIYEDLRKVAALNLKDRGFVADKPEDLACTFSILPQI